MPDWEMPVASRRLRITPLTAGSLALKGMLVTRGLWDDGPTCFAISPDGELLAAGGADKTVTIWALTTGRRVATLRRRRIFRERSWAESVLAGTEPPAVRQVDFSGAQTLIAQIGDGTVTVWDLATGRERYTLRGQRADEHGGANERGGADVHVDIGQHGPPSRHPPVASLAVTPSSTGEVLLVMAARPAGVRLELRETRTGRLLHAADYGSNPLPSPGALFSPDGARVAISVGIWTERAVEVRRTDEWNEPTHLDVGWPAAFAPDGSFVAAVYCARVRVWDAATGRERWRSRDDLAYGRDVRFSPTGEILVAETNREDGSPGLVRVWDATTGRELAPLVSAARGPVVSMAFSPDGRLLAVARYWSLEVWEVGAARLLYRYSHPSHDWLFVPAHGRCVFSPDGGLLALSTLEGLGIWHVPLGSRQG